MEIQTQVRLAILGVLCIGLAGCQSPGEGHASGTISSTAVSGAPAPPAQGGENQPPQETFPAHFQATIYEVEAQAGNTDRINAKALEKQAGTADGLLKALSKAGPARILYRFDQPVNVLSQKLFMGKSEPMVTSTRVMPNGQSINSVTYQQVGADVHLSAPASSGKHPEVTVSVNLKVLARSTVAIDSNQQAPSIRTVSIEHQSELELGRPRLMLAVDSSSLDKNLPPAIYVICYQFGR